MLWEAWGTFKAPALVLDFSIELTTEDDQYVPQLNCGLHGTFGSWRFSPLDITSSSLEV